MSACLQIKHSLDNKKIGRISFMAKERGANEIVIESGNGLAPINSSKFEER